MKLEIIKRKDGVNDYFGKSIAEGGTKYALLKY